MNEQTVQDAETGAAQHPVQTLWILACHIDGFQAHRLVPLYAVSREDAEQQARQWQNAQAYESVCLSLRSFPDGFVMCRQRLIGTIER